MGIIEYLRDYVWAHLPKKATRKQCLWAALIWGGGLILLGGLAYVRGKARIETFEGFVVVGIALAVALLIPGLDSRVYLGLMRVFAIVGWLISRVGLTIIFYVGVTPMGWIMRLLGKDPLEQSFKSGPPPAWHPHSGRNEPKRYYRLF